MMPASKLCSFLFACILLPQAAFANPHVDAVVAELQHHGYERIEISRTLLGRYRVVGTTENAGREIVVYGGTGTVVRDYRFAIDNGSQNDTRQDDADRNDAEVDQLELAPDEEGWTDDQLDQAFPIQTFDYGSDDAFEDEFDPDDQNYSDDDYDDSDADYDDSDDGSDYDSDSSDDDGDW